MWAVWARARVGAATAAATAMAAAATETATAATSSRGSSACALCQHLELDQFEASIGSTVADGPGTYINIHIWTDTFEPGRKIIDVY